MTFTQAKSQRGFTLVEMLVIAPIVIISIGLLIALMINLVGDVVIARERGTQEYDVQNALNEVEQDTKLSSAFAGVFNNMPSPQGKNNSTGAFTATPGVSGGDLIMNQYATTKNPLDTTRELVYYANRPNDCSGDYGANINLFYHSVYFLKTVSGVTSLRKRTFVPTYNTNTGTSADLNSVCKAPWQRNSCDYTVTGAVCQTKDEILVNNVKTFTVTYYTDNTYTTTTSDPSQAQAIKVDLTAEKTVGGETVTSSGSVQSLHTNSVPSSVVTPALSNPTSLLPLQASQILLLCPILNRSPSISTAPMASPATYHAYRSL